LGRFAAADGAAPPEPEDRPLQFEEQVVVTPGKTEQKLQELPVQATVLSSEDVQRSTAQTVADVLLQVPSFSLLRGMSSRAATPPTQAVSLRSMGSSGASRALVVVDGVPLNDPFFGWVAWSQVSLPSVERIEVVPAGGAGAWGNQALAGVINIITRRADRSSLEADAQFGSLQTVDLELGGSRVQGPLGLLLRGSYFDTDGYFALPAEARGPIHTRSGSQTGFLQGRVEYARSPGARFTLQGGYLDDERTTGTPLSQDRAEIVTLRAGGDFSRPGGGSLQASLFTQFRDGSSTRGTINDALTAETPNRNQFEIPSSSLGAGLSWSRPLSPRHLLSAGADAQWTDGEVFDDSRYLSGRFTRRANTGGKQFVVGVYGQDAAALGTRWRASLGGRLDLWRSSQGKDLLQDLESGALLENARFPARSKWVFSPNLGLRFAASERLALRGSVYRTFRAPTPNELFKPIQTGTRAINENNPNLEPERVTIGFESGLDFVTRRFSARVTGFWNELENSITDVTVRIAGPRPELIPPCGLLPARGTCRQKQNLERVRNRGAEAELRFQPHPAWRLSAAHLFAGTEVTRAPNDPQLLGKRLRRVPEQQSSLRIEFAKPGVLDASLLCRYLGERFQDDLNDVRIADSFLFDLRVSRKVTRQLELYAVAENLLDRAFAVDVTSDGVEYGHPRLLHGGVRFRWQGRKAAASGP
jgi:outer membrane receptor protein involved in Fe transport